MKNRLPKICRRADRNLAYVTLRGRKVYLGKYGSPESYAEHERVIAEYLTGPVVKPAPIASFANLPPLSSPALAIITSKTVSRPSRPNVFAPRSSHFSSRRSIGSAFATSASFGSERFSATEKTPVAIVARISTRSLSTRSFNAFAARLSAALPTVTSPQPFWLDSKSRRRSNGDVRPLAKRRRRSRSLRRPARDAFSSRRATPPATERSSAAATQKPLIPSQRKRDAGSKTTFCRFSSSTPPHLTVFLVWFLDCSTEPKAQADATQLRNVLLALPVRRAEILRRKPFLGRPKTPDVQHESKFYLSSKI